MNSRLVRNIFFPLHEFVMSRPTLTFLSELDKSQWLQPDLLKDLQWRKLKKLLVYANERVPYYQQLFKSLDLSPEDIRNEADFPKIPMLTKKLIRENSSSLVAEDFRGKLIKYTTGGSTGDPLTFYTDNVKEAAHNAAKLRARRWWGVNTGDCQVDLWASPVELSKQDRFRSFKDRYFLNFVLLSAFNLTEKSINGYIDAMYSLQPRILYGYATVLYRFAKFCEERGINPKLKTLKAIVSTSEMLYDYQRESIAAVFNKPVVNEYGCRDGGHIAQECPANNMHIAMEHVYVEFIPIEYGNGGLKEVVVTNLDGYGMPFIRYKVGDLANAKEGNCSCGRGLQIIQSIQGRSNDMLVSPAGKMLPASSVSCIFREIGGVLKFKVTQETVDRLVIEIVKNMSFKSTDEAIIRERIYGLMGVSVNIDIVFRDEILSEISGKHRYVVSKVAKNL